MANETVARGKIGPRVAGSSQGRASRNLDHIYRQPVLSRAEEADLARRSRDGDRDAADKLVHSHLRFVVKIARKYRKYGVPMADLIQEGTVGLLQAVRKFDPQRDNRLSTYAMWWIRAAIQDQVVRSWSLVRLGTTTAQKTLFFRIRRMMYELKDGADALTEDLLAPVAKRFGVPVRDVMALAWRAARFDQSLNQPVRRDGSEEWLTHVADQDPSPEDAAADESQKTYRDGMIARALKALPQRERIIIRSRYLAELTKTREALSRELGISKERVRQLEHKALEKMRSILMPLRSGA